MKIKNIIKLTIFVLSATKNFATTLLDADSENVRQEGASQFNPQQTQIFQDHIGSVLDRLFNEFLTSISQVSTYKSLLQGCSKERAAIAEKYKDVDLMDEESASMFLSDRYEFDHGLGLANYSTLLIQKDNPNLVSQLNQNFMNGAKTVGLVSYVLNYMTYSEKQQIATDTKNRLDQLKQIGKPNPADLGFMKENIFGEEECFQKLIAQQWGKKNPGAIERASFDEFLMIESSFFESLRESGSEIVLATLRAYITLREIGIISIGSVNCLARRTETGYEYYNDFVLDHLRSDVIKCLLESAEKYWNDSIFWDKINPKDFLSSLAQFFWAQTIAVPYARGSETIAKWMLALTARYHNKELIYSPEFAFRMPFALTPDEFVDYFQRNVTLKDNTNIL